MSFPAKWHILSLFLMPVVQCIVAQWRHISSESAVLIAVTFVLTMLISDNRILVITVKCDAQTIAWDSLLVITSVAGNLCNKCPKQLLKQNSSYSDYFNVVSGLYQTAEPQEALWHFDGQCGPEVAKTAKTVKTAKYDILPKNCQNRCKAKNDQNSTFRV